MHIWYTFKCNYRQMLSFEFDHPPFKVRPTNASKDSGAPHLCISIAALLGDIPFAHPIDSSRQQLNANQGKRFETLWNVCLSLRLIVLSGWSTVHPQPPSRPTITVQLSIVRILWLILTGTVTDSFIQTSQMRDGTTILVLVAHFKWITQKPACRQRPARIWMTDRSLRGYLWRSKHLILVINGTQNPIIDLGKTDRTSRKIKLGTKYTVDGLSL